MFDKNVMIFYIRLHNEDLRIEQEKGLISTGTF